MDAADTPDNEIPRLTAHLFLDLLTAVDLDAADGQIAPPGVGQMIANRLSEIGAISLVIDDAAPPGSRARLDLLPMVGGLTFILETLLQMAADGRGDDRLVVINDVRTILDAAINGK